MVTFHTYVKLPEGKLVNITTITMVYGRQITILSWGYKPTHNVWGPHIVGSIAMLLYSTREFYSQL